MGIWVVSLVSCGDDAAAPALGSIDPTGGDSSVAVDSSSAVADGAARGEVEGDASASAADSCACDATVPDGGDKKDGASDVLVITDDAAPSFVPVTTGAFPCAAPKAFSSLYLQLDGATPSKLAELVNGAARDVSRHRFGLVEVASPDAGGLSAALSSLSDSRFSPDLTLDRYATVDGSGPKLVSSANQANGYLAVSIGVMETSLALKNLSFEVEASAGCAAVRVTFQASLGYDALLVPVNVAGPDGGTIKRTLGDLIGVSAPDAGVAETGGKGSDAGATTATLPIHGWFVGQPASFTFPSF